MKTLKKRTAFSMIELIFVIVILGIVASIGSEVIAQVYESYIVQRAQYKASIKTELALNQIANRLRYALIDTIVARASKTAAAYSLADITTTNDKVLQWVGYDGDSFEAISSDTNRNPGWSGFCDIDAYTAGSTTLSSPGSNLDLANTIITNLGGNIADAVIYFRGETNPSYGISGGDHENITLDNAIPSGNKIYERYKLAWSSYALEVVANAEGKDDLVLHYNFAPIAGTAINGSSSILLKNITNFRFKSSEGSLRIKICKEEKIGANTTDTIHTCKEKVVF